MFLSIKEFATLIFLKGFQINVKSKHLLEIPEQGHICPEKATIFSGKKSFLGGIIMMHIFVHFSLVRWRRCHSIYYYEGVLFVRFVTLNFTQRITNLEIETSLIFEFCTFRAKTKKEFCVKSHWHTAESY